MAKVEEVLLGKILYIGDKMPLSLIADDRPKFVVLGTPQEFIDALNNKAERPKRPTANPPENIRGSL